MWTGPSNYLERCGRINTQIRVIWEVVHTLLVLAFISSLLFSGCIESRENVEKSMAEQLLPDELAGWKAEEPAETYDTLGIYQYMDGAGEIYRMYDYREMAVRRYIDEKGHEVTVEVFDMSSSEDAYGVFSHTRDSELAVPGQGAEYRTGLLCFWKGKYYVCVKATDIVDDTENALNAIASQIDGLIESEGGKPQMLNYLPPEGLDSNTVRYFHLWTTLNYHYYIADDNILLLDKYTDGLLAHYQPDDIYLVLIKYVSEADAEQAMKNLVEAYLPENTDGNPVQTENGKWVVSDKAGPYVAVVFDAPDELAAVSLLSLTLGGIRQ
jgi:hypothetical protein